MCSPTDINITIPTHEDFLLLMRALAQEPVQTEIKRRVHFAPIVTATAPGPLPFEELKELWYDQTDLMSFKVQAKKIAKQQIVGDLRGLEHCTFERQKHRYMTIRTITSAYRKGLDASTVARKCTKWCEEIAFVQACHDYAHIYQPQLSSMIPAVRPAPDFPFALYKRSASSNSDGCSRRVRQRTSCALQ